jgi:hypothetical protein
MTACCTKLPPLTLFLSDLCGKEPLDGGLLHEASSPSPSSYRICAGSRAEGTSGEYPASPTPAGAILLPLLEPCVG